MGDVLERGLMKTTARYNKKIKIKSDAKEGVNGCMFLGGIILCFTGVGMILGVPMVVYTMFASNKVKGGWVGNCPKCDNEIIWHGANENTASGTFKCPICSSDITFYDGWFSHKPPAID